MEGSVLKNLREIDANKKVVGENTYADCVTQCCLLLGQVYYEPLRQTTGFVTDLVTLFGCLDYAIPDLHHFKPATGLSAHRSQSLTGTIQLDLALESTGLKVYGEEEWKVRKHGASKQRTWWKLHIGIDVTTQRLFVSS